MEQSTLISDPSVRLFLETGKRNGATDAALADAINIEMLHLVQRSLSDALRLSRRLVQRSKSAGRVIQLAAQRALGRSALMSALYDEAETAYRTARKLAGDDALTKGRIDRTLIDVYMYLGKTAESRRRARMALKTFQSLDEPSEIAKTNVNYANVLHRQDRHADAERLYREAADHFEKAGDMPSAARCWFNRANTLVQLFDFDAATELYEKARDVYRAHDRELDAIDAEWGLSWLHMLEGKFHIALQELADCEAAYRRIDVPLRVASCELDRAEVYLNLNLFSDAFVSAREAERQFRALGIRYETSKAAFYLAQAGHALGENRIAGQALRRARIGFEAEQNHGFLGATYLLRGYSARSQSDRGQAFERAFDEFSRAQLPLWQAICDLHLAAIGVDATAPQQRLRENPAVEAAPHLYARWQTILGDRAQQAGDPAAARAHWEAAAHRLDFLRAQLPPLDLRSSFSRQPESPHQRLIESIVEEQPTRAAVWSERLKTAGIWSPLRGNFESLPGRRRVEESLDALAEQYAKLSRQIFSGRERLATDSLQSESITELRSRIRLELARLERPSQLEAADSLLAEAFLSHSKDVTILQFYLSQHDLLAFIHEQGQTRYVRFAAGRAIINRLARQWQFLLESAALSEHLKEPYDLRSETRLMDRLGELLWAPLELDRSAEQILLLPEGDLFNLPWWAIRHGNRPLIEQHRFVHTPSLRHHLHACKQQARSQRISLFVGDARDLQHVPRELDAVLSAAPDHFAIQIHREARRSDWPRRGSARIWHFAGHALLNAENPFYSSLGLHDGPLFAADFRMRRVNVELVTLAACQSGAQVALPGEESTGLVRSLLEMGARNVVAGHWPVADESTAAWMTLFYRAYFKQKNIAEAARYASAAVREKYPSAYHWAAFCLYGAGS